MPIPAYAYHCLPTRVFQIDDNICTEPVWAFQTTLIVHKVMCNVETERDRETEKETRYPMQKKKVKQTKCVPHEPIIVEPLAMILSFSLAPPLARLGQLL